MVILIKKRTLFWRYSYLKRYTEVYEMVSVEIVKEHDRFQVIKQYAEEVIQFSSNLLRLTTLAQEVAHHKEYFSVFYGSNSIEHKLAKVLLNLLLIVERSIDSNQDVSELTIKQWVKQEPLRIHLVEKLRAILEKLR